VGVDGRSRNCDILIRYQMNRITRSFKALVLTGCVLVPVLSAGVPQRPKASHRPPTRIKSGLSVRSAKVQASRTRPSRKVHRAGRRVATPRAVSRHYLVVGQQKPAPERIAEIQQALILKGHLSGSTDGIWDERSIRAMRSFQRDQWLTADGKITSLSLIALGLGPRRGGAPPATRPELPPTLLSSRAAAPRSQ
jgi:hypothetical protein